MPKRSASEVISDSKRSRYTANRVLYAKSKMYLKKKLPNISANVKTYVQRAINRSIEKKQIVSHAVNINIPCASASIPANIPCIPDISQGAAHNQRIGNEVKCSKAVVRGYVNYLPYNIATNPQSSPIWIKMFLVSSKKINTNNFGATSVTSDFFDLGGASGTFNGNMRDMVTPINEDAWTIHSTSTVKLGFTNGNSGGAPVTNATWYDNSQMSAPFYFDYTKHLTKLKYNDATAACTNKNLFVAFQAVYADGTNTAITPAEFHYSLVFDYTDA